MLLGGALELTDDQNQSTKLMLEAFRSLRAQLPGIRPHHKPTRGSINYLAMSTNTPHMRFCFECKHPGQSLRIAIDDRLQPLNHFDPRSR
jgi:hypothetical protein